MGFPQDRTGNLYITRRRHKQLGCGPVYYMKDLNASMSVAAADDRINKFVLRELYQGKLSSVKSW
jgi:hypothetical protein